MSLNTGRIRDHWHTMTRTGLAPELCQHAPEPYVEVHPEDAATSGLIEGQLARIRTEQGEAVAVVRVSDRQRHGSLFMPMHFTAAYAPAGRSNHLIAPNVDPVSGQPEFKHTPARLSAYRETWRGFFIGRAAQAAPNGLELIWRRIPAEGCQLHEFAGRGDVTEREALAKALCADAPSDLLTYEDGATGATRRAHLREGRIERLLFMTVGGRLPPRDWLVALFSMDVLTPEARLALLAGRPVDAAASGGPIVCACLKVGALTIERAIADGCSTLEAVAERTRAGTNCGSCRPEISRVIRRLATPEEARDAA